MDIIEGLSESIMVNLIHTLKENDVKIMGKDFIRDIGFMNEVLKSLLFRELGVQSSIIGFDTTYNSTHKNQRQKRYVYKIQR